MRVASQTSLVQVTVSSGIMKRVFQQPARPPPWCPSLGDADEDERAGEGDGGRLLVDPGTSPVSRFAGVLPTGTPHCCAGRVHVDLQGS